MIVKVLLVYSSTLLVNNLKQSNCNNTKQKTSSECIQNLTNTVHLLPVGHELPPGRSDFPLGLEFTLLDDDMAVFCHLRRDIDGGAHDGPAGEQIELVQDFLNINDETLGECSRKILSDDDAEDGDALSVGRHSIGRNDPAIALQEI